MESQARSEPQTSAEKDSTPPVVLQYLELDSTAHLESPISPNITGTVPVWLEGSLYRNGSGLFTIGKDTWRHMFDGFSVLQRWTIQDGQVTFLSTILDSDHYKKCVKYDRLIGDNFGSSFPDPCKNIFRRFFSYFLPQPPAKSDNTAVNVVEFGDRLFAMTETTVINELHFDTMLKKEEVDIGNILALHMGTAHPQTDKDGSIYYYGTHMNYRKAYNFVRIPKQEKDQNPFTGAEIISSLPSRWKLNIGYTHSFGITENYLIHAEQPMTISMFKILTMSMRGKGIASSFVPKPNEKILFHVVHKKTGKKIPISFFGPYGFIFHFINCYEDSGHIVCDVCLYDGGEIIEELYLDNLVRNVNKPGTVDNCASFARFILPLRMEEVEEGKNLVKLPRTKARAELRPGTKDIIDLTKENFFGDNFQCELPTINSNFNSQKYRYMYATSAIFITTRRLMKFDMVNQTVKEWLCGDAHVPNEPIFVPRPGATQEDDGVVLAPIVADSAAVPSYLIILDAQSFKEIARATLPSDFKLNMSVHGNFSDKVF